MALLDSRTSPARFQIDALDIRPSAIAFAQRRVRQKFLSRERLEFSRATLYRRAPGHALNESVRKLVRFQTGNLLDEKCLPQTAWYDFIFCRNLLIYFDRQTQERVLGKLSRLLTKTGVQVRGRSAENAHRGALRFLFPPPASQSCAAETRQPTIPQVNQARSSSGTAWKRSPQFRIKFRGRQFWRRANLSQRGKSDRPTSVWRGAWRMMAGWGRRGREICESYLKQCGASARGLLFIGPGAGGRRGGLPGGRVLSPGAFYLEPDHYDTVRQWATTFRKEAATARRAQILTGARRAGLERQRPGKHPELWNHAIKIKRWPFSPVGQKAAALNGARHGWRRRGLLGTKSAWPWRWHLPGAFQGNPLPKLPGLILAAGLALLDQ